MRKLVVILELPEYKAELTKIAPDFDIVITGDIDAAAPHLREAEVLAGWNAQAAQLAMESPNLRWVQAWSAGVDGYPLQEMRRRGMYLTNASGVHGPPISESIFAMMLAFARGVYRAIPDQQAALWNKAGHHLWEIHGQTIGILGAGAIGSEVARLAKAFHMRVLGMSRGGAMVPHFDAVYPMGQADALLSQSDFVVNVLPMTPETGHLVNADWFAKMKKTAVYLSAGRGATTDQEALIGALKAGDIAFAGLDVVEPEPLPADNPLWKMKNVIITPHISGGTAHYHRRAMDIFSENLAAYGKDGKPVRNVVDYDLRY